MTRRGDATVATGRGDATVATGGGGGGGGLSSHLLLHLLDMRNEV